MKRVVDVYLEFPDGTMRIDQEVRSSPDHPAMNQEDTEPEKPITEVIFRHWRNKSEGRTPIAIFPYDYEGRGGHHNIDLCQMFEHVGQHGAGDYDIVMRRTKPATLDDEDVRDLKEELESHPYNYRLKVVKRRNHARWRKVVEEEIARQNNWVNQNH